MKVVFILGSGHSGSTLLDLLLDRHTQITGVGEMHALKPGIVCTCGKLAGECPFWSEVAGDDISLDQQVYRTKAEFLLGGRRFLSAATKREIDASTLREKILAMYRRTGSEIVVDSSKSVDRAALLMSGASVEPVAIHLVRDGRAVTWSYMRKYPKRDIRNYFFKWFAENLKVEIFKRRFPGTVIFVRYEDLTTRPGETLKALCAALGIGYEPSMLLFREGKHHQIAGNRMRFGGVQEIKRDDAWQREMPRRYRFVFDIFFGWLNAFYASRRTTRRAE